MIGRVLLIAGALVAGASPASATEVMDKAVAATLYQNCLDFKASAPNSPVVCVDAMTSYQQALNGFKTQAQNDFGSKTWWNVLRKLGLPQPVPISDGSPFFGGGGATGGWDASEPPADYCDDFNYRLSIQGTLIVPAIGLKGGGPMALGPHPDPTYKSTFGQSDITHGGSSGYDMADNPHSLTLWALHHRNRKWTSDFADAPPNGWQGCYAMTANGCHVSSVPYSDHHGNHWMADGTVNYTSGNGFYTNASENNKACPEGFQGGSADVHFYLWGAALNGMNQCTWYIPNKNISPSGYYYPTEVALPGSAMNGFPASIPEVIECNLSADLVKRIAEKLRQTAETAGAEPTKPVEQPKTGGTDPKVEDLGGSEANLNNTGTPTDPTPTPTDPGSGGGSGYQDECDFGPGGCDNPNTGEPTLGETPTGIMDPIFDWLPDLPSITINNQSLQCPVWNVDLRDVMGPTAQYLLDSHCELMESGTLASTLGALMIAVFGIGAALIILRA